MMKDILIFKYKKGVQSVFPAHDLVKNWVFTGSEHDEAELAYQVAKVAEKNGMSATDLGHIFPAILRMLKSDVPWSK